LIFQIQKQFDREEVISILDRSVRNCPWSGDLWGFYIRYLAEKGSPLDNLAALKDRAFGVPWLLSQKEELAKLYFSWLPICRLAVVDWEDESDEALFLLAELTECLEKLGSGEISSRLF
jgi:squamous cell carcinoma antigen recognized by T-cells 3